MESKITQNQKQFFKLLFGDLKQHENIRIIGIHKNDVNNTNIQYFNNINKIIEHCNKFKKNYNLYFNLSTTDGVGGATNNLLNRKVLAFDFDKKVLGDKFNHIDIIRIFKENGLYYHCMISSGNGYHIYMLINQTNNINKLIEVNKIIAGKLNADMQAVLPTQILRIPGTINHKYIDVNKRYVNLIHISPEEKQKEYNLDKLYDKYCLIEDKYIKYINIKKPYCIDKILEGVNEGNRNFCLGRLTSFFKKYNYSEGHTYNIIKEWNNKCNPPQNIDKLEKDFKCYWNTEYKLLGCVTNNPNLQSKLSEYCDRYSCNKIDKNEIIITDGKIVNIHHEYIELLRQKRKENKMTGNHIAVISILNLFSEGLNTNQIKKELTSVLTKKCCMSDPTLNKILNELVDKNILTCIEPNIKNKPNFYILNVKKLKYEYSFLILSYHAIQRFIDKVISPNELRVYCYMRYRRETKRNLTLKDIAIDLGTSEKELFTCIHNLEKARYLSITKDYSINNNGVNIYDFYI